MASMAPREQHSRGKVPIEHPDPDYHSDSDSMSTEIAVREASKADPMPPSEAGQGLSAKSPAPGGAVEPVHPPEDVAGRPGHGRRRLTNVRLVAARPGMRV